MMNNKVCRKEGDIVKIDMGDGTFCFGRVLEEPLLALYGLRTDSIPSFSEIESAPVLFKVWVMNSAVTSGRWPVIGNQPLEESLRLPVKFFKQDPISKKIFLYINAQEIPSTKEECEGLERAAVWSPEHIEDRLRDHFAGISNKWVDSLRIK
ncbi:immunity 26/phosphotriesterase HocA family protein [Methylomonas sp. BW4-1]|uniref:immunity 26/phosphotriesterase HocA family protein n=1 Tax=Methylomonas sp. BW4-1 TaxID=3376685 RepID=UPI00404244F8